MKRWILVATIVMLATVVTQALAQEAASTGPKTLSATLTGTFAAPVSGACSTTTGDYDAICPSANCRCFADSSATVTGSLAGKGSAIIDVTSDDGDITTPTPPDGCTPFFGVVQLTTVLKKVSLTKTINLTGAECRHTAKGKPDSINGGFGILNASNAATGWGTLTGTADGTTGALKLTLKGSITQ